MDNIIIMDAWALNGALVDAIEYYLYSKSINKDIKLVFIEHPNYFNVRTVIKNIIDERYNLGFDWADGVVYWNSHIKLIENRYDNILVFDYTTLEHVPIMRGTKIHILYDHEPSKKRLYNILNMHDHIRIYNEMPFGIGEKYYMKFAFSLYKPLTTSTETSFIDKKEGRIVMEHKKGLFDFGIYEYIHDGTFDRRPRMIIEASFYNKQIIYDNKQNTRDGSYYRFHDLKMNGVDHRFLTPDDEIIKQL